MKDVDDLGFARVDLDRFRRQGAAEVVFGEGKTASQIAGVLKALRRRGQSPAIATRVDAKKAAKVVAALGKGVEYFPEARFLRVGAARKPDGIGTVVVAAAGTSDIPIAEEAALTAETFGNKVRRLYDVGVAGIHRLLACKDDISSATAVVAVAGMEGALASVVGGLASCPVIAVPTSVGYGASFGGITALLAMMNSCAAGVSVVNIDNGFGAGFIAHRINHVGARKTRRAQSCSCRKRTLSQKSRQEA